MEKKKKKTVTLNQEGPICDSKLFWDICPLTIMLKIFP